MNIHESVFSSQVTGDDPSDGTALRVVAAWWRAITTQEERASWAVLDVHHYHAWTPECAGTVDGRGSNYTCGDADAMRETFEREYPHMLGPEGQLLVADFDADVEAEVAGNEGASGS